jgi:hypothetical protein
MGPKSTNELVDGIGDGAKDGSHVAVSFASGLLLARRGCGIDMARRVGSMAKSGHGSAGTVSSVGIRLKEEGL